MTSCLLFFSSSAASLNCSSSRVCRSAYRGPNESSAVELTLEDQRGELERTDEVGLHLLNGLVRDRETELLLGDGEVEPKL